MEALDALSGEGVWSYRYPTGYRDDFGFDPGPRASPVVVGGQVYTFGAEGTLHCLEFATGKKIWSVDTQTQFGVRKGFFGAAGSPLVKAPRFPDVGGSADWLVASTDTAAALASNHAKPLLLAVTDFRRRSALFFSREEAVAWSRKQAKWL